MTGNPLTPAVAAIYDADAGAYSPINGTPFSARSGPFSRLDLRVDKTWQITQTFKLGVHLDIQNAYFRANPEGRTYSYNYAQSSVMTGLPFLPVLGVRGEL